MCWRLYCSTGKFLQKTFWDFVRKQTSRSSNFGICALTFRMRSNLHLKFLHMQWPCSELSCQHRKHDWEAPSGDAHKHCYRDKQDNQQKRALIVHNSMHIIIVRTTKSSRTSYHIYTTAQTAVSRYSSSSALVIGRVLHHRPNGQRCFCNG